MASASEKQIFIHLGRYYITFYLEFVYFVLNFKNVFMNWLFDFSEFAAVWK